MLLEWTICTPAVLVCQKKDLLIIIFFGSLRDASIKCPLNTHKGVNAKRDQPCFIQIWLEDACPCDRENPNYTVDIIISTYFLPLLTDLQIARAKVERFSFSVGIWEGRNE